MSIDHLPDADLQMLLEVNKKGFDLFNELPVGDRLDYAISYDFHLTNGRHSRLIHHHLTPILLSFAKMGVKNIAEALFHTVNYQII